MSILPNCLSQFCKRSSVFALESKKLRGELQGWLPWGLSGQFSKKKLGHEHFMLLKWILPKERQIWLPGKEPVGHGGLHHSSPSTAFRSKPLTPPRNVTPQELLSIPVTVLTTPASIISVPPHRKVWIFLTSPSHQQSNHNSVLFPVPLQGFSLLWALCGSRVLFHGAQWAS